MSEKLSYSIDEAARRIGVSKNVIYQLAKAQLIPVIRIGRRYVINAEQFDAWFREQTQNKSSIEL